MPSTVYYQGAPQRLKNRGLSESTCQRYKIYRDGSVLRFYYHSPNGQLLGCKVKTKDKSFTYEGETDGSFFGQQLWPAKGKQVVITEGELDAASCNEALPGWPMVSLPTGAAGAEEVNAKESGVVTEL